MNGPAHYAEAERLVEAAKKDFREAAEGPARTLAEARAHVALAAANVHAQLASTAAFVMPFTGAPNPQDDADAWSEALR